MKFYLVAFTFLITGCKNQEITPKQAAEIYCDCLSKSKNDKTQNRYIKCNTLIMAKSSLYKKYIMGTYKDSIVEYSEKEKKQIHEFLYDFMDYSRKICPNDN